MIVHIHKCIDSRVYVCLCKRKEGKRKRFYALAFSSSPFSVADSEEGAEDDQHGASLEPKF